MQFCISISLEAGREEVNIYVGNISYGTGEDDLRDLFARYGEVSAALDSNDFMGRDLRVNEARPREPR